MKTRPRVAIVGAGLMGRWHAHACTRAGGRVVAILDPDERAAHALSAHHPGALAAASLADVPTKATVDLIHICTPLDTHETEVLRAVTRGCPALVEKPVGPTAPVTERLIGSAKDAGVWIEPVHQLIFQRGVQHAQAWVRTAGALRLFDYRVCSVGAAGRAGQADQVAAGVLSHPLSLIEALLPGGLGDLSPGHVERPDAGELSVSTLAGRTAVRILISTHGRPPRHELTLVADRGTLTVDLFHGFAWRDWNGDSRLHKLGRPLAGATALLSHAAANLARRAVEREPAYPGLTTLVRRVYAALSDSTVRPLGDSHMLAVAWSRDHILRQVADLNAPRGTASKRMLV